MIAELSQICLSLALSIALISGLYSIWHVTRRSLAEQALSRGLTGSALICFALVALSFAGLVACFVTDDFSVRNVAENSNSLLPLQYKIAASWGSHEGSLLLW